MSMLSNAGIVGAAALVAYFVHSRNGEPVHKPESYCPTDGFLKTKDGARNITNSFGSVYLGEMFSPFPKERVFLFPQSERFENPLSCKDEKIVVFDPTTQNILKIFRKVFG